MEQHQQHWDKLIQVSVLSTCSAAHSSSQDYSDSRHATRPSTTAAVFIGNKGSGKTSLIHKFSKFTSNDQNRGILPDVEPTPNAIEYFYVRRQLASVEKGGIEVAHLFDAGPSKTAWQLFEPVRSVTISVELSSQISRRFNNIVVVVVVDLSQPSSIYSGAMEGLRVAHKILSKVSHSAAAAPRILMAATKHERLSEIMDPNHARRLLDALRSICNHQQASLISLSLRGGDGSLKAFTSFLRANLFPTTSAIPLIPQLLSNCSDYSKPLAISFGTDRLEGIEEPYEGWEVNLSKIFPTTKSSPSIDDEQQAGTGLEPRVAAIVEKEKAQLLRKELAAACS
ncbi:hypothetical protein FOZ61_000245 [Perkinsus olseni]|uniref:Cytoplasmic dynein 2 light intermediate chain 1 n=1 Tax=Perkinsus olseni TaxID=32597 RepID=A0A7J6KUE1_PEROL|nr:hypothetical protein FOZ61_000245 [Perkinsus olseni]